MDQLLTLEFWKVQIEVATSSLWVVIPLLLIAGIIGWKAKGIINDRKIRGLRTEIIPASNFSRLMTSRNLLPTK